MSNTDHVVRRRERGIRVAQPVRIGQSFCYFTYSGALPIVFGTLYSIAEHKFHVGLDQLVLHPQDRKIILCAKSALSRIVRPHLTQEDELDVGQRNNDRVCIKSIGTGVFIPSLVEVVKEHSKFDHRAHLRVNRDNITVAYLRG